MMMTTVYMALINKAKRKKYRKPNRYRNICEKPTLKTEPRKIQKRIAIPTLKTDP